MSNAFSQFPGGPQSVMPSAADVRRVQTSLAGTEVSPVAFATSLYESATSMGSAPSLGTEWLTRALPDALASATSSMDAGLSHIHKRDDTPKHWAIMGKPRRDNGSWNDGGFDEQVLLWAASRDYKKSTQVTQYVENVCGVNYYCELNTVIARTSTLVSRDRVPYFQRQFQLDEDYSPATPRDYRAKWKHLGPIQRPPEGTFNGQDLLDTSGNSGARLIPYVFDGTAKTKNLFGTRVRAGDKLFITCTKIANPYSEFFMPNGHVSTARSGTAGESLLQVRGFSSSELGFVPVDSSGGDARDPLDTDTNYVEFRERVATVAQRVDWDDARDTFIYRSVAKEEGFQEAENALNTVEFEALKTGSVEYLGMALDFEGGPMPGQRELDLAHRSPVAMLRLPTVRYLITRQMNVSN